MKTIARIGQISDLHVQEKIRLAGSLNVCKTAADIFEQERVTHIFVGGDLAGKDAPHRLSKPERLALCDIMSWFASIAPVFVIRGNHDYPGELAIFTKLLTKYPIHVADGGVKVVSEPGDALAVTMMPWLPIRDLVRVDKYESKEEANAAALVNLGNSIVDSLDHKKINVAMAHEPVIGAKIKGFILNSVRDTWLTPEWLDMMPFSYVAIGHIHERQQIASRAFYIGSPYPTDFSEGGDRGVVITDIMADGSFVNHHHPIKSWKMVTYSMKWDGEKFDRNPIKDLTQEEAEDSYFKVQISLDFGVPHNSVPFMDSICSPILRKGGYIDPTNNISFLHLPRDGSSTQPSVVLPLRESMIARCRGMLDDGNIDEAMYNALMEALETGMNDAV